VVAAAGGRALSEAYRPDSVYLKGESEYIEMVKAVVGSDSVRALMTTTSLLSDESPVSDDHLFTNLLRNELVKDIHCFFDAETRQFHSVIGLGADVCGHPTIVHGGLTAAIMDEAFGGLIFCMKRWKMLDPGPPFTVKVRSRALCIYTMSKASGIGVELFPYEPFGLPFGVIAPLDSMLLTCFADLSHVVRL
jgi:hypothetical protein